MPKVKINSIILKIFLWAMLPFGVYSQSYSDIESLKLKLAEKDKTALDSAYTKIQLANYFIYHDLEVATLYIDSVLDGIAQKDYILPDTFHKHLLIKAWTHQGKQQFEEANQYVDQAMFVARDNKNRDDKLELLMNKGALLLQTKNSNLLDFVEQQLQEVDTTLSKADYIMYTLLHQYKSRAYALEEDYEGAIKTLLKVSDSNFLNKIPSYKYGIRSTLSTYIAFLGDNETAAKQLQMALKDKLHKHQEKQIYYDLCQLKINTDSTASASKYVELFHAITPHTQVDRRDYHYLSASIKNHDTNYALSLSHIDSALLLQDGIQNNQKLLDVILLKASICEKMKRKNSMLACVQMIDSIMAKDESLATTINNTRVSKVRLLNMFLQSNTPYGKNFATYDSLNTKLVKKKIDPKLVAALLDYDNAEQAYQIIQLAQTNASMNERLGIISDRLQFSLVCALVLPLILGFIYYRIFIRKGNTVQRSSEQERESNKQTPVLPEPTNSKVQNDEKGKLEVSKVRSEFMAIITKSKVHKIKIDQLLYMSAENDGTRFYLKAKEFFIIIPLKEVAKQLPDNHFIRIFRSTIVNINCIQLVDSKHIVLENGKKLVMSRTYKENVKRRLTNKK